MEKELQVVTLEQAMLLKEVGFDWMNTDDEYSENKLYSFCRSAAEYGGQKYKLVDVNFLNTSHDAERYDYVSKPTYYAPTLALVLKWLRDVHEIYIRPYKLTGSSTIPNKYALEIYGEKTLSGCGNFDTWEEAESHGINLTLQRIKEKK